MHLTRLLGQAPEALLFDLDGTLIDSVPDLATAVDATLEQAGYQGVGEGRVRGWVGNGARKLMARALAFASGREAGDEQLDQWLPVFFETYQRCCTDKTLIYPGVNDALQGWHRAGIRLACVTNKPERFALAIIRHFGWGEIMPVVLGGDSLPQRKPAPEPLWEACAQLRVSRQSAIMVGDSVNDVLAARAAGMPVVAVPYGYNYGSDIRDAGPDLVVARLDDLLSAPV